MWRRIWPVRLLKQVARIEKRGYESYTLNTLRRYVDALGGEFSLVVRVRHGKPTDCAIAAGQ